MIVYVHGGGWTFGSIDTHDGTMRELAVASGCAVFGFDYRLAPEHPFPAPLDDVLAVIAFVRRAVSGPGRRSRSPSRATLRGPRWRSPPCCGCGTPGRPCPRRRRCSMAASRRSSTRRATALRGRLPARPRSTCAGTGATTWPAFDAPPAAGRAAQRRSRRPAAALSHAAGLDPLRDDTACSPRGSPRPASRSGSTTCRESSTAACACAGGSRPVRA